jgi:hypothetical protein
MDMLSPWVKDMTIRLPPPDSRSESAGGSRVTPIECAIARTLWQKRDSSAARRWPSLKEVSNIRRASQERQSPRSGRPCSGLEGLATTRRFPA